MYLKDLSINTPPAAEPISLAEAKSHLRIGHSQDDAKINDLITVARQKLEKEMSRAFITQTITAIFEGHDGKIDIPRSPIQTLNSVTELYWDSHDNITLDSYTYRLIGSDSPTLYVDFSRQLTTRINPYGYRFFELDLKVGYGDKATDVPQSIREAIKRIVHEYYYNRSDVIVSGVEAMDVKTVAGVQGIIFNYANPKSRI